MKNIKYFIPIIIILLMPWTFRLSLENIMLAVPETTLQNAKEISWILGGLTTFAIFMSFVFMDMLK